MRIAGLVVLLGMSAGVTIGLPGAGGQNAWGAAKVTSTTTLKAKQVCDQVKAARKTFLDLGKTETPELLRYTDIPPNVQKKMIKKIGAVSDALHALLKVAPKEIATHVNRELEFQNTSLVFVTRGNDSLRNLLNRAGSIIAPPDGDTTFNRNVLRMCGVYLDR